MYKKSPPFSRKVSEASSIDINNLFGLSSEFHNVERMVTHQLKQKEEEEEDVSKMLDFTDMSVDQQ